MKKIKQEIIGTSDYPSNIAHLDVNRTVLFHLELIDDDSALEDQ